MYTIENEGLDWNNISLAIGSADTRLMGYLQSLEEVPGVLNNASASTQGFSQYLIQTGQAYDLAALSATLFNSAINAGITLLVVLQVKLLSSVWDHFNVTVAETKEKIEGVNTRLSELNAEYETLNAIGKESLSKTEQERLDYLDKRIDKEEELLELLEAKAIQEEIGGKFTDLFDEDSYTRKMFDEIFGKSNPLELIFGGGSDNLGTLKRNTDRSLSSYDKLNEDIKVFEKQMEDNSKGSSEYNHAAQQFEKTQDKLHNDVISDLQDEFLHWKEKKLEYEDAIAQLNKDLQNPNLPSKTRKNAEEKIKKYQSWLNGAETYIEKLSAILDSPQQLVESLASRLSNISSKDLRDNFSEDEISILANLKFSNDSTIEDLKALLKETQDTSDATKPVFDPVLFKETLNQENFSDTREDLLELAKTGKLTAESLEQTKGADTFLEEVSMSAEEAVEQLKNLLFTQEMLTDYNNVLDPLTSSYREFQELGYITQQTLEALPEMITSLESFDLFSQIAGDPDQSAEHIQEAFQKIIKQLLTSEDTVSSILNASRGEILVYIQNLRDMNIQNAEELVNGILTFPEHLKTLDEAEQEYLNYLNNKEGYDAKYINNVSSKNSLLISALGAPYQTDYINWINLLQKKVEAYNTFVNSISNSQIVPSGAPYSVYGLAEQVMKESYGKEPLDLSPKNFGPFGFKKNPNASAYTKEQIDAAQNLLDSRDKSNALKRELALDLSPIDPSFNSYYSPGGGGSRSSGGAPAPTPQVYDWIEKKIAAITKQTEQAAKAFEKAFTKTSTQEKFGAYLSQLESAISANREAAWAYQQHLYKIGLSQEWVDRIQNGAYAIESVTDETLKKQISDYENYYNKRSKCDEDLIALEEKKEQAQKSYADKTISYHEKEISRMERSISAREAFVKLSEAFGGHAGKKSLKKQQNLSAKALATLRKQNKELVNLQKTVDKGTQAWDAYQEQIKKNNDSSKEFIQSISELAEKLANLPLDRLERFLEKNKTKNELYEAQIENTTGTRNKNKLLDKQAKLAAKENAKTQKIKNEAVDNFLDSKSFLPKAKDKDAKGLDKSGKTALNKTYKKLKQYTKKHKEIPTDLISKLAKAGYRNLAQAASNYNAALAAKDTARETAKLTAQSTRRQIAELSLKKFQNLQDKYGQQQDGINNRVESVNSAMSLAEAKGHLADPSHYRELISLEKENKKSLKKERNRLQKELNNAVASGKIKKFSPEWREMAQAIYEVDQALAKSLENLENFNNQLRQIRFDRFDYLQEQISQFGSEADFYINVMENKPLTDENGLTQYGTATIGLHYQKSQIYQEQAKQYGEEIEKLEEEIKKNPTDTALIEQKQKYVELQQESILNSEKEQQAIGDLVKQGYQALIDSLSESVSKYKELLQNAKNAHDYQKNISQQTENISTLKKQINAYASMTDNEEVSARACLKIAFCQMCFSLCGRFMQNEEYRWQE